MMIGDIATDDLVQVVTLVLSVIGLGLWLAWGVKSHRLGYAVASAAFLFHRAVFYVVIALFKLPSDVIVMWSSAISLHGVLTLLMAIAVMWLITRKRERS